MYLGGRPRLYVNETGIGPRRFSYVALNIEGVNKVKKILALLATMAMVVGVVASANAATSHGTPAKKPASATTHARKGLSQARVAKMIKSGQLKQVTAKQRVGLRALQSRTGQLGLSNARAAGAATQGTYYIGSYQEQGRLWYDYRYSYGYSNSSYYWYYYYKNWKVCNSSYSYCYAAGSYDYYYYIYYYGTWYYGGWYGPYSG